MIFPKPKLKKWTPMKTMKTKSGIRHLREWFRALVNYQLNPRWISDPVAHRAARPAILGAESERERKANDEICARFTATAGRAKK